MPVYERHSFLKDLGHDDQRLIDGTVSVGMIFTHRIADNTGRLSVGLVGTEAQLAHIIKHTALHGFKAVPGIGNRPGRNDAHGIIHVTALHLFRVFRCDNFLSHSLFYLLQS